MSEVADPTAQRNCCPTHPLQEHETSCYNHPDNGSSDPAPKKEVKDVVVGRDKTEEEKKTVAAPNLPDIVLDASGAMRPKNLMDLIYLSQKYAQSKVFSSTFETPQAIFVALQLACEKGLPPATVLNSSFVVNNRMKSHSELPVAVLQMSGKCTYYREYLIDKDYNEICLKNKNLHIIPWAGICETKRQGSDEIQTTWFTIDDANRAKLTKKDVWEKYQGRMLLARARQHNISYYFADVTCGLPENEDYDEIRPAKNVGPDPAEEYRKLTLSANEEKLNNTMKALENAGK